MTNELKIRETVTRSIIGVIALLVAGCNFFESPIENAEEEISVFHEAYNAGEYGAIYSRSSEHLIESVSSHVFEQRLANLQSEVGQYRSSRLLKTSSSSSPSCVKAEIVRYSQFDRGSVEEIFEYVLEDEEYRLKSYFLGPFNEYPDLGNAHGVSLGGC